uniref:Coiled-coil domain containing 38 n=1 Tax=Myotis lucifugus TaxID=59463 RepID=G1PZM3_MYOLU
QYAVSNKRNTITRYDKHIMTKERQINRAEIKLQEDAIAFEEFLRENDQRSINALKIAAQETINKLQMTAELKKATMEVQAVKSSEISKTEFLLREYIKYGLFLLKLSPKHWQLRQALRRAKMSKSREHIEENLSKILTIRIGERVAESLKSAGVRKDDLEGPGRHWMKRPETTLPLLSSKPGSVLNQSESSEDSLECLIDDEMDFEMEPELYFKEPEELLQVLTELEEQNLTLVQYSQDVDENLEEVNKREKFLQGEMFMNDIYIVRPYSSGAPISDNMILSHRNSNIEFLLEQKEMLRDNCVREEEKAAELELRSRLFSFGEFDSDSQEKLIDSLSKKINQVYKFCIGDSEVGSLNPLQKLVKVESRLVELSDLIDAIPKENVEAIERIKLKERRQKFREEKMREKQKHQEERLKAALERAVAQPKKKLGRRLVWRSKPLSDSKHQLLLVKDTRVKSIEEEYFFT